MFFFFCRKGRPPDESAKPANRHHNKTMALAMEEGTELRKQSEREREREREREIESEREGERERERERERQRQRERERFSFFVVLRHGAEREELGPLDV